MVETSVETSVEGVGLHSGRPARVVLRRQAGPVTIGVGRLEARMDELSIVSTTRGTTVEAHGGALRIGTVEHAFAALGGLRVYEGVGLHLEGPELPLLDGGAAAWCDALTRLRVTARGSRMRVNKAAFIEVAGSQYEFAPADAVEVEVCLVLDGIDGALVAREASWGGDGADFHSRIAPARTFTLARDLDELLAHGLARHVDPESVVVVAPGGVHHRGMPFSADEPARHKLLDLIGDLYLHGGPPIGRIRALRPGHRANAAAMHRARAEGIVVFG